MECRRWACWTCAENADGSLEAAGPGPKEGGMGAETCCEFWAGVGVVEDVMG